MPPEAKNCVDSRNPTPDEMAAMHKKVDDANPKPKQAPGGPPPPTPAERPANAFAGG